MSKTPPGPNELRLREMREERAARAAVAAPRKLVPYAGKDKSPNSGGLMGQKNKIRPPNADFSTKPLKLQRKKKK